MKKILLSVFVLFFMLISLNLEVYAKTKDAEHKYSKVPTEGTMSGKSNYGVGYGRLPVINDRNQIESMVASSGAIKAAFCEIRNTYGGNICVGATTTTFYEANEIGYTLYVQAWDGYKWVNVRSFSSYSSYTDYFANYHYTNVIPGYYYRVKVQHYAISEGTTYYCTSISDYIYIY